MGQVALVVFAKTVGLSPVKTRLQSGFGKEATERIYRSFCACTRTVLDEVASRSGHRVTRYWAVPEQEALALPMDPGWQVTWQGSGEGLGSKLSYVYDLLLKTHEEVVFLGADAPHLPVHYVIEGIGGLVSEGADYVFGPATDGGFYLFAGRKPIAATIWNAVVYSQSDTRKQLQKLLSLSGGKFSKDLPELQDIDTVEELRSLPAFCRAHADALLECQLSLAKIVAQELDLSGTVEKPGIDGFI